jgi:hypothetical protein
MLIILYKYLCLCFNKSVLYWSFCQSLLWSSIRGRSKTQLYENVLKLGNEVLLFFLCIMAKYLGCCLPPSFPSLPSPCWGLESVAETWNFWSDLTFTILVTFYIFRAIWVFQWSWHTWVQLNTDLFISKAKYFYTKWYRPKPF